MPKKYPINDLSNISLFIKYNNDKRIKFGSDKIVKKEYYYIDENGNHLNTIIKYIYLKPFI